MADEMVTQSTIHFPVIGGGGELCAGLGAREEGGCQANVDFPKEPGNADAMQQNRTKWDGCSISPMSSEAHIGRTHVLKSGQQGRVSGIIPFTHLTKLTPTMLVTCAPTAESQLGRIVHVIPELHYAPFALDCIPRSMAIKII